MAQTLIARGQATITIQKDGYTITQSLGEYIFPADQSGKILSAVSVTSTISVTLGDSAFSNFTIGTISKLGDCAYGKVAERTIAEGY